MNFTNPKYAGMQKVTVCDNYDSVREALENMVRKGEISQETYQRTMSEMTRSLTDERIGVSSDGTSTKELLRFRSKNGTVDVDAIKSYARSFEYQQYAKECVGAGLNGAVAGAVMGGTIASVKNLFEVYQNRKSLDTALEEVGLVAKKGAIRGGLTGVASSVLRIFGQKTGTVISDGNIATALAAGMVDCGASIYAYAKNEISGAQLASEVKDTAVKVSASYYFTAVLKTTLGVGSGVFLPMAIYAVTSSMVMSTKAIIDQAKLNAAEHRRLAALYEEEAKQTRIYRNQIKQQFNRFRDDRRKIMMKFMKDFDNNIMVTMDCVGAVNSLVELSNQLGYSLQHKEYSEFARAMNNHDTFVLK